MSFPALAWASKYRADSAAMKLVLLAFADRHNEETGCAYPSIDWLCEFSSLNRKTVIGAIAKLEAAAVLVDTGDRVGRTMQIKVYRVAVGNSAEIGTVPKTEQSQKRNSSENGGKQSQKRDTEPVRNQASPKASPSTKPRARPAAFVPPSDIPEAEWEAFEEMRRKIGKPLTDVARRLAVDRLRKFADAGWPPGDVLNHSVLNDYQGLFPPKDGRNGTLQSSAGQGLRGGRPDPAVDMHRHATDRLKAEGAGGDREADRGAGLPLPSYLTD